MRAMSRRWWPWTVSFTGAEEPVLAAQVPGAGVRRRVSGKSLIDVLEVMVQARRRSAAQGRVLHRIAGTTSVSWSERWLPSRRSAARCVSMR